MPRPGPLQGITVIDLTRVLAGPYCTLMLAELGARVIKIEEPGTGDDSRAFAPIIQGRPCYFASVNRNKESVALNLKKTEDRLLFEQLLDKADLIAENFRPGVMEKLGYGWETLHARYPKLIYLGVSGYGHTGPASELPAYDMVIQGVSGMMSVTGDPDGEPCRAGISIADVGTGLFAAVAVNAALLHRERTGETTKIDMGMLDCMMMLLETPVGRYLTTGEVFGRMGSAHAGIMPFEALATQDGYVALACGNEKTFGFLCEALGHPDWARDPRFSSNVARVANRPALRAQIEACLIHYPTDYWIGFLSEQGVPVGPINDIAQAVSHPQVGARNMIVKAVDPVLGEFRMVGSPFKLSAFADPTTRRIGPDLDQDRSRVFEDLGVKVPV